jgi:hypothetical protein
MKMEDYMKYLLFLLFLLMCCIALSSCRIVVTQHMASGHATEKVSDNTETDTKVNAEASGLGSLFGL